MPDRELELTIKANGFETVNQVFEGMKKVGGASRATAADLGLYEVAVKNGIITGNEFNRVLNAITQNEKRAADEVQRYGQMVARAEAEDRRRTASLNAQAAAQQRATAAAAKAAQNQTLSGARGAAGFGQLAGILPGGTSTAVSGASSLLNAGLSSTAALAGTAAFAIGILSVGIVKAANSLGTYAREQENLSQRTGLTTVQTQLFGRAAGLVDVNAGTLATTMRTLSKALSDNSEEGKKAKEALAELGIGAVDQLAPMGDLLPLIARRLGGMADGAEKDRIAIALLGRSALELLPLLNNFDSLASAVTASGVVIDRDGIQKALEYQREVKELGLTWDALVNKFKQGAVGTVSFVLRASRELKPAGGESGKELELLYRELFGGTPTLPNAPTPAFPRFDPSQLRLNQRESEIAGINNAYSTPKEQIDQRIKSLKELQGTAEGAYRGANAGPEKNTAADRLKDVDRQLRAAEQQRDALKDGNRASEETLRLREELIGATAKEFTGEEKITAEYEKQIQRLKDKREATPENVNLAGQIRDANLSRYRQQATIAATDSQSSVTEALLRAGQDRVRSTASRRAQLALQGLQQSGDEAGGIQARQGQEVADAKQEYEFAKQTAAVKLAAAEKDHDSRGDDIKYLSELTSVQTSEIAARQAMEDKISNARLQAEIALNALKEKNRKEEEQSAEENIKRGRQYSDLRFGVGRATTEGQSSLNVANAAPGFELQAQLDADQSKLALDRSQALINQSRSTQDISGLQGLKSNDPARNREIEQKIADIKLESAKEAAKIEEDTIKARFDAEVKIAEERNKREQDFRSSATGFLSASMQRQGSEYIRNIGKNTLNTITGNVAGLAFPSFDKITGGISQSLSGTAAKPTFLGALLAGTGLGPRAVNPIAGTATGTTGGTGLKNNPVDATNQNTSALSDLDKSIILLNETITAIVTGQPLPSGVSSTSTTGGFSPFGIPGLSSLAPGLGTLGSAIGVFGNDTNGLTGAGPLVQAQQAIRAIAGAGSAGSSSAGGVSSSLNALAGLFGQPSFPAGSFPLDTSVATSPANSAWGTDSAGNAIPNPNIANRDEVSNAAASTNPATSIITSMNSLAKTLGGTASGGASVPGGLKGPIGVLTNPGSSTLNDVGAGIAIGAAAYGAEQGIVQITKGGTKNVVSGIGKVAGSVASVDPDPSGISQTVLGGIALVSTVVSAILGDPRVARQTQENTEIGKSAYQAPATINRTQDIFGDYTDADKYGHLQTSSFSAVPQTTAPFIHKYNGSYYDVPGSVTSPFTPVANPSASAPQIIQNNTFASIDPKSAMDFFKSNPDVSNGIVHAGLTMATGPAQAAVRKTAGIN